MRVLAAPVLPPPLPPTPPERGWGELYEAHAEYVWRTLQRLGLPSSDAEDGLQEVFLVVQRRLGDFDPERGTERAWLTGIAVNIARALRRRARSSTAVDAGAPSDGACALPLEAASDGRTSIAQNELRRALTTAIAALDPERNLVFVMFEMEGLDCATIASELGIPIGTVYSRLHSARSALRTSLAPHHSSPPETQR